MVAHIHTPNIRRIYDRPRQRGTAADPGKVPTCVQVAVRPETTVRALETMFRALPQLSTFVTTSTMRHSLYHMVRFAHPQFLP